MVSNGLIAFCLLVKFEYNFMHSFCVLAGFIGVYMAGHILEVTKSWSAVFNQTAIVSLVGWIVYTIFGTGKQII